MTMHVGRFYRAAWSIFALSLVAGCGTTSQLVDVWRDPTYTNGAFSNVLVVGMMRNPVRRRLWEDQLASEMQKHGARATPSYQLFPESLPDSTTMIEAVQSRGFDGVLFTSMLPTETSRRYVPGYVESRPVTRYSWRWNAYYTRYTDYYRPGYTETERVARLRTDVWTTGEDGHLVWSGTTEVIDPSSARDVTHEVAHLIVPELVKQGVVQVSG